MAKLTKGYPFAFQVLGYLCWKYKDNKLNMNSSEMSVYRNRLGKRGIVDISKYGYISLKLPRFDYYVKMCVMDME